MMQVSKKIPFDNPDVLNLCRAGYALSNVIILGIYLYIKTIIDKKKGMLHDSLASPHIRLPINPRRCTLLVAGFA